jgi:hypothetical protein
MVVPVGTTVSAHLVKKKGASRVGSLPISRAWAA